MYWDVGQGTQGLNCKGWMIWGDLFSSMIVVNMYHKKCLKVSQSPKTVPVIVNQAAIK